MLRAWTVRAGVELVDLGEQALHRRELLRRIQVVPALHRTRVSLQLQ